jgi:hypothetical protein
MRSDALGVESPPVVVPMVNYRCRDAREKHTEE